MEKTTGFVVAAEVISGLCVNERAMGVLGGSPRTSRPGEDELGAFADFVAASFRFCNSSLMNLGVSGTELYDAGFLAVPVLAAAATAASLAADELPGGLLWCRTISPGALGAVPLAVAIAWLFGIRAVTNAPPTVGAWRPRVACAGLVSIAGVAPTGTRGSAAAATVRIF